ncbi:MAG: hypothetical protein PUC06_01195 [Oscillospiraceae bacterium]|nr:hypothetical protein [Oscillospiraceae bacterium]
MAGKGKLMNIMSKKIVKLVVWVLIAVTLLGGCNPQRYSERQEEALVQACLPAVHEFLAERCGEYELGEFHLAEGQLEENTWFGRYGSNVVRGSYTAAGNTWGLVYDRETGDFYTDELLEKLRNQEQARILEYLKDELPEEDLRDFALTSLHIQYTAQSHDIRIDSSTAADTYVCVSNMLPAGITEAELPEFAARGFDGGAVVSISCHYYSDRANALTQKAFAQFLTDNPAYQVDGHRVFIYNDNPSAKEENTESAEKTWFCPEPIGEDNDCKIEYENGMILARRPHFTESDGIVTMQFNGIDWYRVRVIRREDAEKYFPDEKMLAQSSNLKVFQSYGNQKFEYSCVFVPYDGSNYVFLFETDISPEETRFGSEFNDYIHYYAGGEEVFPDRELER